MTKEEANAMIVALQNALESMLFEDDVTCTLMMGEHSIRTTKLANGFGWEMVMLYQKTVSSNPYDTLKDAQAGLKLAVKAEIARLYDLSMPPAKQELHPE